MSTLLDEVIAARRARAIEYEEYLRRIADIATQVNTGQSDDTPELLNTPGKRALWNNLNQDMALALQIDRTVKVVRPDEWRGYQAKENVIKAAIFEIVEEQGEVERIFKSSITSVSIDG